MKNKPKNSKINKPKIPLHESDVDFFNVEKDPYKIWLSEMKKKEINSLEIDPLKIKYIRLWNYSSIVVVFLLSVMLWLAHEKNKLEKKIPQGQYLIVDPRN